MVEIDHLGRFEAAAELLHLSQGSGAAAPLAIAGAVVRDATVVAAQWVGSVVAWRPVWGGLLFAVERVRAELGAETHARVDVVELVVMSVHEAGVVPVAPADPVGPAGEPAFVGRDWAVALRRPRRLAVWRFAELSA